MSDGMSFVMKTVDLMTVPLIAMVGPLLENLLRVNPNCLIMDSVGRVDRKWQQPKIELFI